MCLVGVTWVTKYGFRLLDKHKKKIRNNYVIKLSKLQWSNIPKRMSIQDYQYHINEFTQFNKSYEKEFKSLLGLINFAVQVNPKYSKYKYLIENNLIFPHQTLNIKPNKQNLPSNKARRKSQKNLAILSKNKILKWKNSYWY